MFKEYFYFEFKNRHRQIHYAIFTAVICLLIFGLTIFGASFLNASTAHFQRQVIVYEIGLWLFCLTYFSTGIFSMEGQSYFFLNRIIHSPKMIYYTKLLVLLCTALESAIYFFFSKLLATVIFSKWNNYPISLGHLLSYSYFLLFIPLVYGVVITIDLKMKSFPVSLVLNLVIAILFYDTLYYLNLIHPLNPWSKPLFNLLIVLAGIIICFINSLQLINNSFFKRINYANYPN
ncbi:hypothetical protein [Xylocopilactobacillus apis]|uniref:hypothetical protein n=1 Tax=Xylocopilactobacillus apis TaxID=2932183 RepID=UPI002952C461|nr:hypothetical protein [Xylocopilactobacillus apis]